MGPKVFHWGSGRPSEHGAHAVGAGCTGRLALQHKTPLPSRDLLTLTHREGFKAPSKLVVHYLLCHCLYVPDPIPQTLLQGLTRHIPYPNPVESRVRPGRNKSSADFWGHCWIFRLQLPTSSAAPEDTLVVICRAGCNAHACLAGATFHMTN